jgi:Glycosyltransferase family 87
LQLRAVTASSRAGVVIGVDAADASPPAGDLPAWLPPLSVAGALVALAILLVWAAFEYAQVLAASGVGGTDFAQYSVAARLTLAHGWPAPYDVAGFMTALHTLTEGHDAYAAPPPATVLAMPLARLPLGLAYAIWNVLLVGGYTIAVAAVAPGRGWERVVQVMASLSAFQVLSAIALGQLGLAVSGLVVLHWWLLRGDRPLLAGTALGLAFLKPQNVFLVPVALVLSGRVRPALACLATAAGIGTACAIALGPDGVRAYVQTVAFEQQYMSTAGRFTLAAALGGGTPALGVAVIPAALAVLAALRARGRGPDRTIVSGVLGSQLATPYLNGADLALLVPCAWLTLRSRPPRWLPWVAVGVSFVPFVQDRLLHLTVTGLMLVWLVALALPVWRSTGTDG